MLKIKETEAAKENPPKSSWTDGCTGYSQTLMQRAKDRIKKKGAHIIPLSLPRHVLSFYFSQLGAPGQITISQNNLSSRDHEDKKNANACSRR